jgi:CHASE2 domain-containing sensor protein
VLAGIVLLVLGLISADTDRGKAMLVSGMLLGSLGGLDTALREHFSGYRSHTTIIAGLPAVGLAAVLFFAGAPWPAVTATAVLTFVAGFWLLARAYRRR